MIPSHKAFSPSGRLPSSSFPCYISSVFALTNDAVNSYVEDLESRLERMEKLMSKVRLFARLSLSENFQDATILFLVYPRQGHRQGARRPRL